MSDVIIGYFLMFFMGFIIALIVMLLSDNNNATIENDVFAQAMDRRRLQRKQSELRCELEMLKKQWEE